MPKEIRVRLTWGDILLCGVLPCFIVWCFLHFYSDAGDAGLYTILAIAIVGLMFYGAVSTPDVPVNKRNDLSSRIWKAVTFSTEGDEMVTDSDTMSIVMGKLKIAKESEVACKTLIGLRKRVHAKVDSAIEALNVGFIEVAFSGIKNIPSSDKRVACTFDVLNELFNHASVRDQIASNDNQLRYIIQELTTFVIETISALKKEAEIDATAQFAAGQDRREKDTFITKYLKDTEFGKIGYKCLMTIGILAMHSEKVQTRIVDRSAFVAIIECMRSFNTSPNMVKWGCWATTNLVLNNPPNKRDFVQKSGLEAMIDALKLHPMDADLLQQGFISSFAVFAPDEKSKMNLPNVRQSALACGIVDVVQLAKRTYPKNETLTKCGNDILEVLISDFS